MEKSESAKPRLVSAGEGFSVLKTVEYNGRFLYSRYNPAKSVESAVENLCILPGTLVVICSPVLWYGFNLLLKKIPADCRIISLEDDENLFNLAQEFFPGGTDFFHLNDFLSLDSCVRNFCRSGKIKRAVKIDFSAGVNFSAEKYRTVFCAVQEIISTFWKNRITLVKMGRLFSRNFFRNIKFLSQDLLLDEVKNSVSKPIIVCGAGESLDFLDFKNFRREDFFILSVDAALQNLFSRKIKADAAVAVESQGAVEKFYIGMQKNEIPFFLDLASRNEAAEKLCGKRIWFASRFSEGKFFDSLREKKIVENFLEPMGSVGLCAVFVALKIRRSADVPVFVTGMDFSFSAGRTHARKCASTISRISESTRIFSAENFDASFSENSVCTADKNGRKIFSTKIMIQYAAQFSLSFKNQKNLFDVSPGGISLGLERRELFLPDENFPKSAEENFSAKKNPFRKNEVTEFYRTEKNALEKIRDLLSSGEKSSFREKNIPLEKQIENLAAPREYLFLHFPDGENFKSDRSFLTRIRAETDFFLKQIKIALAEPE